MKFARALASSLALALSLSACATGGSVEPAQRVAAPVEDRAPVTILISIDGFHPDYLKRGATPVLSRLAADGVQGVMCPSFPTKTFPNHYTLVTGLRPDRNGVVANKMEDPRRPGEIFTMASDDPFWWNEARPIWVDAEKAGMRTATMFWPGSNVAIGGTRAAQWPFTISGGTRPEDWQQFNQEVTGTQRVNAVIDWLRRPAAIRPRLVTLYFDTIDTAGHRFGPEATETTQALRDVDTMIGALEDGLTSLGQPANLVIVSDHGMAATTTTRSIALDTIAAPDDYRLIETGPYAAIEAKPGREAALEAKLLKPHAHMECWRKDQIPARFHYGRNPRVPAYLCLAETGWTVEATAPRTQFSGGAHGYDNMAPEMASLFVAHGPAFRRGATVAAFDNVDIHPLLAHLIGLPAEPRDGSLEALRPALTQPRGDACRLTFS